MAQQAAFSVAFNLEPQFDSAKLQGALNQIQQTIKATPDLDLQMQMPGLDTEQAQAVVNSLKAQNEEVTNLVIKTKEYKDAMGETQTAITSVSADLKNWQVSSEGIAEVTKKFSLNLVDSGMRVSEMSQKYEGLRQNAEEWYARSESMSEKERNAIQGSVKTLQDLIDKYKQMGSASPAEIKKLEDEINNANKALETTIASTKRSATGLQSWGETIERAIKQTISYSLSLGLVRAAQRALNDAIQYTIDLNTEMTKIQVLQAEGAQTPEEINALAKSYNELAKELGATTLEVAEGSVEWLRQGKTIEETTDLMRASTMMAKLGNVELAQSTEFLTSTINGFEMEAEDAISIVDKLVHIDNIAATSTEELATALRYVSAVAKQSGVTFDELVSYIAVLSETTRLNAEQIGQSLKTIFTRMQDIMQGGLDEDGLGINNVERALERVDVQLRDSETSFRNLSDVLEDVAGKWDTLNEVEQANIAKSIAGVRQQNMFRILMSEMSTAIEYQEEAYGALGTATDRYAIYLESIEAKQATLKASIEGLYQDALQDGLIASLYDLGIFIVDTIDEIGGLQTVITSLIGVFIILKKEAISSVIVSVSSFISKIVQLIAVEGVATTATKGLAAAMSLLNTTNPIGWVVLIGTALAAGIPFIKAITKDIDDLTEKSREARESLKETSDQLNSLQSKRNTVYELWKEFEELSEKTELSADELQRYYDIQSEIASLLPNVNHYYDENGRLILIQSTNLAELNDILDEQIAKQYEKLRLDAELAVSAEKDVLNAYKRKKAWAEAAQVVMETTENEAFLFKSSEKWQEQLESSSEGILKSADIIKQNFNKLGIEGKQALIAGLKSEEGYEDLVNDLTEMLTQAVDDAVKRTQEDPNISLVNLFDDFGGEKEIEEVGMNAAQEYVYGLLTGMGLSEDEISEQMEEIFKSAIPTGDFFSKNIPQIQKGVESLAEAFKKVSENELIDDKQIENLESLGIYIQYALDGTRTFYTETEDGSKKAISSLEEYIDAQLAILGATNRINPVTLEVARNMLYASTATETMADSIDKASSNVELLSSAMQEQADNGYISTQTALELVTANSSLRNALVKTANGFYLNEEAAKRATWAEFENAAAKAQIPGLAAAAAQGNWILAQSLIMTSEAAQGTKTSLLDLLGVYASFASMDFGGGGGGGGGGGSNPAQEALQDQIDALQDVIDRENRLWQKRTRAWDRAIEDLNRQIDAINKQYDKLIKPFQDQVDALQKAIDDSAEALDDLKWSYQDRLWELEDAIEDWEDQIDTLEEALEEETRVWREEIEMWEDYIDDLEEEIDALEDARDMELKPLEDQLEDIEKLREDEIKRVDELKDEYKKQSNALKDLLKQYNEYIDAQKESLKLMKEEQEYLDGIKEKNEELADIRSEIALLSLDDSEKAIAERLKLEAEAASIEEELAEKQADREYELKIKALDDAREAFENNINAQLDAIDELVDALDAQIEEYDKIIQSLNDQIDGINNRYDTEIEAIEETIDHYEDLIKTNNRLIEDTEKRYEDQIKDIEELIETYQDEIDAINDIIEEAERQHEILSRNNEEQIEDIEARIEAINEERDALIEAIEARIAAIEEERFQATRAHEDKMWQLEEEMRALQELMEQYEDVGGGGGAAWKGITDEMKEYMKELEKARALLTSFKIDLTGLSDQAIIDIYRMTKEWYASGSSIDEAAEASNIMARVMKDALDDVDDSLTDTQDEIDDVRNFIDLLGLDTSNMGKEAVKDIGEMIQEWITSGSTIDQIRKKVETFPNAYFSVNATDNATSKITSIIQEIQKLKDKNITITTTHKDEYKAHQGGLIPYHNGGTVETHHTGESFAGGLRSNEVFAKLLRGEYVATEGQMDNFLKNILPRIIATSSPNIARSKSEKEVNVSLSIPITVQGNMDKDIIPDIDEIADKAIGKINDILIERGIRRNVTNFGF